MSLAFLLSGLSSAVLIIALSGNGFRFFPPHAGRRFPLQMCCA
jgi:uroporphyrinogen-III synthase